MQVRAHGLVFNGPGEESDVGLGLQVQAMRTAIYEEARRAELAELDADLAALEAEEGITSAELAEGIARGALAVTLRRAWWLARWRLRGRLVASS